VGDSETIAVGLSGISTPATVTGKAGASVVVVGATVVVGAAVVVVAAAWVVVGAAVVVGSAAVVVGATVVVGAAVVGGLVDVAVASGWAVVSLVSPPHALAATSSATRSS